MDLFCNLKDGSVWRERTGTGGNVTLELNQGDKLRFRLWFMQESDGPKLKVPVALPTPYTLINVAGKAESALAGDLIFSVGDWSAVSETFDAGLDTEYVEVHYEADLNLATVEIAAVLDPSVGDPVDEFRFNWSIQLSNGLTGDDYLAWTVVPRGTGLMLRDIYTGGSEPVDADPPYPAADQLAPISGLNYQIANRGGSMVFELLNTTTSAFHRVTIEGAAGEEVLVIHEAS